MVNFYPGYISDARRRWEADRAAEETRFNAPPFGGLYIGQPERAKAALAAWEKEHPKPPATLQQVADHIVHIRNVAGVDYVGIGSDFDGINDQMTATVPNLQFAVSRPRTRQSDPCHRRPAPLVSARVETPSARNFEL
jgi:microsomal dipeptidase-like Zn-dependent dipeptidase